jgi:hypothetical protein
VAPNGFLSGRLRKPMQQQRSKTPLGAQTEKSVFR